jgi:hypothetical protein
MGGYCIRISDGWVNVSDSHSIPRTKPFYLLPRDSSPRDMTTRIKVKNAETGASVDMDLEQDNTVEEIIESAASYWE